MQLTPELYCLPLRSVRDGQTHVYHLSLLLDETAGPTLIDTGLPTQYATLVAKLAEVGVAATSLVQIIVTHQDIDHVGLLHVLVQASGARVLTHTIEAPYIDGRQLPRFARPEVLAQRPELRPVAAHFQPTAVDVLLEDGTRLDLAGGVVALLTPGHTPGHICLYHTRSKTLIAGDALTASDGQLRGPNEMATPDMAAASRSVARLATLDVQTIICYHGGVVRTDAQAQLQRVAGELGHLS